MTRFPSAIAVACLVAGWSGAAAAGSPAEREGLVPGADGVRLFHRRTGSGRQALVLLHGGPGSNFRGQGDVMERLVEGDRTLVLYDQRGSGRSELVMDPTRLTADHHVRDLEALRVHFGFERMTLIGMSWGCGLAALYATAHPQRVDRLLLVSPMPPTIGRFRERIATLTRLQGEETAARRREILKRMPQSGDEEAVALCRQLSDITFRPYVVDPTPAKLAHAALRCDIPAAAIRNRQVVEAATLASIGDWDFLPIAPRIRVPALVVEGARTNVPLEGAREWVAALPDARLVLIPDAGHESFLDQPDAFLAAADAFLRGGWPEIAVKASPSPAVR